MGNGSVSRETRESGYLRECGRLGVRVLATLISTLNPSLMVIGDVTNIGHSPLDEIRSTVYGRSLPRAMRSLPVVLSELDRLSGVTSAGVLVAVGVLQTARLG